MPFINLDLDGVFADFYGVAARFLGVPYQSISGADAWAVLDKVPHLFKTLPLLAEGKLLWNGLQPYKEHLRVLTARPRPTGYLTSAAVDKRYWVRHVLSPTLQVLTVDHGAAKAQFAAPGELLIDDLERNILAWEAAGGIGILHIDAATTLARLRQLVPLE